MRRDMLDHLIGSAKKFQQDLCSPENTCPMSQTAAALKAAEAVVQDMMSKISTLCEKMTDMVAGPAIKQEKVTLNPADTKLKAEIDSGEIAAGSTVGKSFIREAKPGTKMREEYDALSLADKAEFRMTWAKKKMRNAMVKYEKKAIEEQTEKVTGRYMPFKVLWDQEGGDDAGYEATQIDLKA